MAAALCTALMLAPVPTGASAAAEAPVTEAIGAWIDGIDASPDWSASYRGLAYNPTADRATISGLSIRSVPPGVAVDVPELTIDGFVSAGEVGIAARRLAADSAEVRVGFFTVTLAGVDLDEFVLPPVPGFVWDGRHPYAGGIAVTAILARLRMSGGRLASAALVEAREGVNSLVSYRNVQIGKWSGGSIATLSAGPVGMEAPSPNPLVDMTIRRLEVHGIDLDSLLEVYDPGRYVGGRGDRVWRPAVADATYTGMTIAAPGATVTVGRLALEDQRVRQPPRSFATLFERTDAAALDDPQAILDMLSAFSFGRISMGPVDVDAIGIDRFHLGELSFADVSTDAIGAFAVDDLDAAVGGEVSLKIGRFAVGDLTLPDGSDMVAALAAGDLDYRAFLPVFGFVEVAGFDLAVAGQQPTRLGRLRLDIGDYIGTVPTAFALDVEDADFATSMVEPTPVRRLAESLGYDRVRLDSAVRIDRDESDDTITVEDFRLAMAGVGRLSGDATFAGPERAAIERAAGLGEVLDATFLEHGTVTFEDDSIVERGLARQAARLKVDPDKFREQFARGLPLMLSFLGDRAFQTEAGPVLQDFVLAPGSLTLAAAPSDPVAVSAILAAARRSPLTLPALLAATVTGTAGPKPAATAAEAQPVDDAGTEAAGDPRPASDGGLTPIAGDKESADEPSVEMRPTIEPAE